MPRFFPRNLDNYAQGRGLENEATTVRVFKQLVEFVIASPRGRGPVGVAIPGIPAPFLYTPLKQTVSSRTSGGRAGSLRSKEPQPSHWKAVMKAYPSPLTVRLFMVLTSSGAGAAVFGAIALSVAAFMLT